MSASILVVDDEPDVADLFGQGFRRESRQDRYFIHFATSGAEALDRLAEEIQPTLVAVLSDINMPGMDGLELLGEIKQRRPDPPVMMVTAYGDDERRRRARELGAFEFITEPVDFDRLKEQLRQLPAAANSDGVHSVRAGRIGDRDRDCCAQFCCPRPAGTQQLPHCRIMSLRQPPSAGPTGNLTGGPGSGTG
jgi:CheY-like chemotaxis protein